MLETDGRSFGLNIDTLVSLSAGHLGKWMRMRHGCNWSWDMVGVIMSDVRRMKHDMQCQCDASVYAIGYQDRYFK